MYKRQAYPNAEVISGYTAFLLGARSVVGNTTMTVKYTYKWNDYRTEKKYARELINEKCVIISQHSDTAGPATACEAVSYTHLDVYKRQLPMWINFTLRITALKEVLSLIEGNLAFYPFINTVIGMTYDFLPFMILPLYTTCLLYTSTLITVLSSMKRFMIQVLHLYIIWQLLLWL